MAANPKVTQAAIAKAVGVSQSWVSLYKSGEQDADVDQLDAMARVFHHTLFEVFDLRPDPKEAALIDAYRKVLPEKRQLAIDVVQGLVVPTDERPPRRARNGGK